MVKAPEKHMERYGKADTGRLPSGLPALSISMSEAVYAGAAACLVLVRRWRVRLLT